MKNITMFVATTVAPAGVENINETIIPIIKHKTAITAENTHTFLKLLNTLIAVRAGNIIRAEIRSVPIIRIPSTIVIAESTAVTEL